MSNEQLIDRIVSEVLSELGRQVQSPSLNTCDSKSEANIQHLDDPVITAGLLETQLTGTTQITLGAASILTPSARDYLSSNQISFERRTGAQITQGNAQPSLAIISHCTPAVIQAIDDFNRHSASPCGKELVGDTSETIGAAISALCRADANLVVAFTTQPDVVACEANRNRQVRAAVVNDLQDVKSLTLRANLYVLHPQSKSFMMLRQILKQCLQN